MESFDILLWLLGVVGFVFIIGSVVNVWYFDDGRDQACTDLGMEKKITNRFQTCIEPDGTAHIVDFKCTGMLWNTKCSVQFIKPQTFGVEVV